MPRAKSAFNRGRDSRDDRTKRAWQFNGGSYRPGSFRRDRPLPTCPPRLAPTRPARVICPARNRTGVRICACFSLAFVLAFVTSRRSAVLANVSLANAFLTRWFSSLRGLAREGVRRCVQSPRDLDGPLPRPGSPAETVVMYLFLISWKRGSAPLPCPASSGSLHDDDIKISPRVRGRRDAERIAEKVGEPLVKTESARRM